jgi:thioredoxin 1
MTQRRKENQDGPHLREFSVHRDPRKEHVMHFVNSIAADRFDEELAGTEVPVLIAFYSHGCPACKRLAPFLEALAEEYAGRVRIRRVNVEDEPELAQSHDIRVVPTVLFFWDGREVDRAEGLTSPYGLMVKMTQLEEFMHPELVAVS